MDDNESIESSLVTTIVKSDLAELSADLADAALDDLPIPVFSTLRKLYRGARTVQNYFYVKKVIEYLREFNDIPPDKRRDRLAAQVTTSEEKKKFGEHIMLVLDRLNDIGKARLMGLATRAFLDGRIDLEQLKSLDFVIDAVDIRLLPTLKKLAQGGFGASQSEKQSLSSCGLMALKLDIDTEETGVAGLDSYSSHQSMNLLKSARMDYSLTDLAYLLVDVCLAE